jgi:hypothetical protein
MDLGVIRVGLLHSSVEIAQMWMDKVAIVRTVDRKGANEEFKTMQVVDSAASCCAGRWQFGIG